MSKKEYLIVVQRRASLKDKYEGGQQNFKNWRDFLEATRLHDTEAGAWDEFHSAGSFNNFSGNKLSASCYEKSTFDRFLEEGLKVKDTFVLEQTAVITKEIVASSLQEAVSIWDGQRADTVVKSSVRLIEQLRDHK